MATQARDWSERMVGEVVAEDYRRAAVFQRHGIDFCCGGKRTVGAACEKAGVEYRDVARSLEASDAVHAENGADDTAEWSLTRLMDHIVASHHAYVRETLPVLQQFASKVARVHGQRHEELQEIHALVEELAADMTAHLAEEEDEVFPRLARLADEAGAGLDAEAVKTAVAPLEDDHERAGELMARIRALSDDFTPPADACNTYRATYAKLEEFETDLHRHVHLENNVLFPRAQAELVAA